MEKEKSEFEVVPEMELEITEVKLENAQRQNGLFERVRLKSNKGDITHKMYKISTSIGTAGEFETIERNRVPVLLEEVPKIFLDIVKIIKAKNVCKIKTAYTTTTQIKDGEEIKYRFISEKQLKGIKVLDNVEIEEKV